MPNNISSDLETLKHYEQECFHLHAMGALLHWDERTQMPRTVASKRAKTNSVLAKILHEKVTAPEVGMLINRLKKSETSLELWDKANLREVELHYQRATELPTDFVAEFSENATNAMAAWLDARDKNDFGIFKPHFQKLIDLRRQEIELRLKARGSDADPYEVMLEGYEPFMPVSECDALFSTLRDPLSEFIKSSAPKTRDLGKKAELAFQKGIQQKLFPVDKVRKVAIHFIEKLGFDLSRGRVDGTVHPFCLGLVGESRLTTYFDESRPLTTIFALIHEAGHGLYNQGLPETWFERAVGQHRSLGVHESQSLFWENIIARSLAFWQFALPIMDEHLPGVFSDVTPEDMFQFVNRVTPSFIRVDADETTYPLHIIIRYEMERMIVDGALNAAQARDVWNEKYSTVLGIEPKQDREGILQDVHWSEGLFGYFPTYGLGCFLSAQLYQRVQQDIPDIDGQISAGNFSDILTWMRNTIQKHGCLMQTGDLLEQAVGQRYQTESFMNYITNKVNSAISMG